ncbi:hypothetical protein [Aestuariibacter salexigens]|uniref:hypothetical protein n=1 Tax=Aestuariibacter salexigens TaxID=226010 RepID=UPI00047ADD47|nr:hypothetical protein [Aestuariibacter salexigens]
MKTFNQLRMQFGNSERLEERTIRTGAAIAYASQSKKHGDAANKHFNNAKSYLHRNNGDIPDQLNNVSRALIEICNGLQELRNQSGSITALGLSVVLLSKRRKSRRR